MIEYPHPRKARWRKMLTGSADYQYTIDYYPAVIGTIKQDGDMWHWICRLQMGNLVNDINPQGKTKTIEQAKSIVECIWKETGNIEMFQMEQGM